jgi:hypothetical protein
MSSNYHPTDLLWFANKIQSYENKEHFMRDANIAVAMDDHVWFERNTFREIAGEHKGKYRYAYENWYFSVKKIKDVWRVVWEKASKK